MGDLKLKIPRKNWWISAGSTAFRNWRFFGSVLRDDFGTGSDVDVLVEFEEGYTPGLAFFAMPDELKKILGREVDLLTFQGVMASRNPICRKAILDSARVYYVAG